MIIDLISFTLRARISGPVLLRTRPQSYGARPDSDWDVVAFTDRAPSEPEKLFLSNQLSECTVEGGIIELVIAHSDRWNDERQCMTELRKGCGLRLR